MRRSSRARQACLASAIAEVGVNAALVELVEDDRAEIGEQRIGLQARGQDAFGHDQQPRVAREPALEANLPADLAAERPAALVGDARAMARAATRRGCSRMTGPSSSERRRHARRLAGAGCGGDDDGAGLTRPRRCDRGTSRWNGIAWRSTRRKPSATKVTRDRARLDLRGYDIARRHADRTADAGAAEPAVAARILRQVLLVVVLGVVELGRRQNLGGDRRRSRLR